MIKKKNYEIFVLDLLDVDFVLFDLVVEFGVFFFEDFLLFLFVVFLDVFFFGVGLVFFVLDVFCFFLFDWGIIGCRLIWNYMWEKSL